jgi:dolichol kinase
VSNPAPAELPGLDLDVAPPVVAVTRPANYTRSLFHLCSAAVALVALRVLPGRGYVIAVAAAFAVAGWSMEIGRRHSPAVSRIVMRMFARVAHPHERYRINSSTWYVTALLALAIAAPMRAAEIGILVLGIADPAAGFVGRRFGRTRLSANRSLEGTLTFAVVGAVAAVSWLAAFYALSMPTLLLLGAAGAVAGALAELLSTRLDDNFTIPIASAAAISLVQVFLPTI